MVLNITLGIEYDLALASALDDVITFDALPADEIARLRSSAAPDAILLLGGNDTANDNIESRLYAGNAGADILLGNGGADTLFGGRDNDRIEGGSEDDLLAGNIGNDFMTGDSGNDILLGGQNEDLLLGGEGNDSLSGDLGFDTLTGGGGADLFFLPASGQQGSDVITDFQDGVDKLRLPDGVSFANLQIQSSGASTLIFLNGTQLANVSNVASSAIGSDDFVGGASTPPIGDPGNSPGDALNLGVLTGTQVFNEFVGGSDMDDFYRFEVSSPIDFFIFLDGLSADADVRLYQDRNQNNQLDGDILEISASAGIRSEYISRTLNIGTYFVNVEPDDEGDNTNYSLQIANETTETLNIGELAGTFPFSGSLVPLNIRDTYQFQLSSPKTVTISLSGLSNDADLRLYEDSNRDGLRDSIVEISASAGTRAESIERNLPIGTYFVSVQADDLGDSTAYDLVISG